MRGVLAVTDGNAVELEITDLLRDDSGDQLAIGDVIGGSFVPELPCGGALEVQAGREVLALWQRGMLDRYPHCVDYRMCSEQRCGLPPTTGATPEWDACDMDCIVSTRDACLAHTEEALLSGRFVLLPWADEIDLGAGQRLPAAEAAVLSDPLSCMARFPAPPVPCNDLILIGVSPSSCAVAAPAADTEPALAIFGWLTGVALLAARRRPRR